MTHPKWHEDLDAALTAGSFDRTVEALAASVPDENPKLDVDQENWDLYDDGTGWGFLRGYPFALSVIRGALEELAKTELGPLWHAAPDRQLLIHQVCLRQYRKVQDSGLLDPGPHFLEHALPALNRALITLVDAGRWDHVLALCDEAVALVEGPVGVAQMPDIGCTIAQFVHGWKAIALMRLCRFDDASAQLPLAGERFEVLADLIRLAQLGTYLWLDVVLEKYATHQDPDNDLHRVSSMYQEMEMDGEVHRGCYPSHFERGTAMVAMAVEAIPELAERLARYGLLDPDAAGGRAGDPYATLPDDDAVFGVVAQPPRPRDVASAAPLPPSVTALADIAAGKGKPPPRVWRPQQPVGDDWF